MFMVLSSSLGNRVIARVHPVHAMNADQRQTAANLWTNPTDLSRRSACRQHVTTSTIAIYYYSAPKLIRILPSRRGYKAEPTYIAGYTSRRFTCPQAVIHPSTVTGPVSTNYVDQGQRANHYTTPAAVYIVRCRCTGADES